MREPRPEPAPYSEPDDAWSRAWGTHALQDLGRYLMANGATAEDAALLVEQTWIFYSYEVLPALKRQTPMAIAVESAHERPRIQLTLLISVADDGDFIATDDVISRLQGVFRHRFSDPLATIADLTAQAAKVMDFQRQRFPPSSRNLDLIRLQTLNSGNWDFATVYIDDLVSELATIMDARDVTPWLGTPNLMFGGLAPSALLGTPDEHLLRDVVTRAKFNLPAA